MSILITTITKKLSTPKIRETLVKKTKQAKQNLTNHFNKTYKKNNQQ